MSALWRWTADRLQARLEYHGSKRRFAKREHFDPDLVKRVAAELGVPLPVVRCRKLATAKTEEIVRLLALNHGNTPPVAALFGVHLRTFTNECRHRGIRLLRGHGHAFTWAAPTLAALLREHGSIPAVARHLGVSRSLVHDYVTRFGLPIERRRNMDPVTGRFRLRSPSPVV